MGKTRDLFKKIEGIKGTFHMRMSMIKDRNSKDQTEVEEVKRVDKYTLRTIKIYLNDPGSEDSMVTHLEPDILEYEVMWASGRFTINKASGGERIPAELFQI